VAIKNISIFRKISKIINEDIYIGGEHKHAMPIGDFITLIVTIQLKLFSPYRK
jgi:hypothetical protein